MKLPGISSLWFVDADRLPAYVRESDMAGIIPLIMLDADEILVAPNASAASEAEMTPEGTISKSTLSFSTDEAIIDADDSNKAFIIGDAMGRFWLMGAKEPPFPKIKEQNDFSSPSEGKAAYYYSVEWSSRLIECRFVSSF